MNNEITFGFSPNNTRTATVFRIARAGVGTVVNGLGTTVFSSTVEVFAKVPAHLGSTAADALNAAQRGITLSPNLLLLVSDLRDKYNKGGIHQRSLPAALLTYCVASRAEEELARRRADGWKPNLPTD